MQDVQFGAPPPATSTLEPGPGISTILVRALIEAVEASGVAVADFLREVGVAVESFASYGWLPASEFDRLITHAVAMTGDAAFGLHWNERSPMLKFDVVAMATAYAPSLRESLDCVLRFQPLLYQRPELALVEQGQQIALRLAPLTTTELSTRVRTELGVSSLVRLTRHVGAPDCAVLRVAFAYPAPSYVHEYLRLFGTRAQFGQDWSGIEIDAQWLDRRVHHANQELHQLLRSQAQEVLARVQTKISHAEQLREHLRSVFPSLPEMREAARAMGLSERSLRRRLAEESWSYSAILLESQQRLAQQLLIDPTRSIKQIGRDVGFTNDASFFRAFKRWTGESPARYRSARRSVAGTTGDAHTTTEQPRLL
jgi:AraC-like DNA-binding protein